MENVRVIPVLLLKGMGLYKSIKFKDHKYVGDPINAIKIFNEKEVDELVFLDITATVEGREPNYDMLTDIASECFMPLCYGGGIKSLSQIEKILYCGVEKVSLNSQAFENPKLIAEASEKFGSSTIVVSMDVKKGFLSGQNVYTMAGTKNTKKSPVDYAKQIEDLGAGEILLNSIDQDGVMNGYDLDLVHAISSNVSIPVIACGGAGAVQHFKDAVNKGASAVAAGSFFVFQGKHRAVLITYPSKKELI
ncbi:AglZ/HisF2 family acetamidino modification protein [Pedobacter flavus]|uniref:imidazole glycerol-phosphate synthase n=1 Tax=Pedobacter flavus TaxID=3113906 RepID=A0ABU7H0D7_9SPHI|nr:AglZ/HisF2 family acetamidino modification protein [Pedobacter sp. VNH31]MEE1884714.1 AglZ/HisF2 family acetamidino modification protein [Pedobacter sp. VNH31]